VLDSGDVIAPLCGRTHPRIRGRMPAATYLPDYIYTPNVQYSPTKEVA